LLRDAFNLIADVAELRWAAIKASPYGVEKLKNLTERMRIKCEQKV
jgi:hypothetical protein